MLSKPRLVREEKEEIVQEAAQISDKISDKTITTPQQQLKGHATVLYCPFDVRPHAIYSLQSVSR